MMDQTVNIKEPVSIENVEKLVPEEIKNKPKFRLEKVILGLAGFLLLVLLIFTLFIFKGKNELNDTNEKSPAEPTLMISPTTIPVPTNETPSSVPSQGNTYTAPSSWESYTDQEAGITINYPPEFIPKYNPNRGVGISYSAGSYLLNITNDTILDYYYFSYDGGSRRVAYYKIAQFDGPEDMSKYTVSADDFYINNQKYLKLVTNYYAQNEKLGGNRVFLLLPKGNKMYYFTYPKKLEENTVLFNNILTIVSSAVFTEGKTKELIPCYPFVFDPAKDDSWQANINTNGEMEIIQKTTLRLNHNVLDKRKISIYTNFQDLKKANVEIIDYDIAINSSSKGNYQDAFTITIHKQDVDNIARETPSTISSVAVAVKVYGGLETEDGKMCNSGGSKMHYTNKP